MSEDEMSAQKVRLEEDGATNAQVRFPNPLAPKASEAGNLTKMPQLELMERLLNVNF